MTIASEITDLQNNLAAAKTAVTTKGGTVGDTGLAGLADEIATIPTGAPNTWGSLTYVDSEDVSHEVNIQSEDEFLSLGNPNNISITIGGETFNLRDITSINIGLKAGYAPSDFLCFCKKLTSITGVENLLYIENNFLQGCSALDCELNFTGLLHVGNNFLGNCTSLNHQVSMPEIRHIGSYFMISCTAYAQSLTIPDNFPISRANTANGFMYNCYNFTNLIYNASTVIPDGSQSLSTNNVDAVMYTTGITVTGTYASDLKTAFPDRSSSPYRKLILGS